MDSISPEIQNYIEILEKTNQQLSLWYNPYGIIIGALAILFTVLTIVAAVIIYRQSRDYKNKLKADRDFYKNKIADFLDSQKRIIEQRNKTIEELSRKIDDILKEYKKKLKESSQKQKKEIQKAIDKLEIEKLTLQKDIGPMTVSPNFDYSSITTIGLSKKLHKCSACGFGFYIDIGNFQSLVSGCYFSGNKTVVCPKCQNIEII